MYFLASLAMSFFPRWVYFSSVQCCRAHSADFCSIGVLSRSPLLVPCCLFPQDLWELTGFETLSPLLNVSEFSQQVQKLLETWVDRLPVSMWANRLCFTCVETHVPSTAYDLFLLCAADEIPPGLKINPTLRNNWFAFFFSPKHVICLFIFLLSNPYL